MKTRNLTAILLTVSIVAACAALPAGRAEGLSEVLGPGWLRKMYLDEDEAPWAAGYMAKLKAKGLMSGYADNRFRPNAAVSRAELVAAAVKLIGAEDEAESRTGSSLPFADEAYIKSNCSWAVGYLATALKHGIIKSSSDRFQPHDQATRLWAAEIFTRAMSLESAAQARMSATLSYRDAVLIPANKVGYVAVMADYGIMKGSDDRFKPISFVSRGELAAILDRCDEWMAPRASSELRGVISSVDSGKGKVSIRLYDREWWAGDREDASEDEVFSGSTTLTVSPLALILVDNEYADLDDLRAGYRVVVLESSDEATVIDASTVEIVGWPGSTDVGDVAEAEDEDEEEEEDQEVDEEEEDEDEEDTDGPELVAGVVKSIDLKSHREITLRDLNKKTRTFEIAEDCEVRLKSGRQSQVEDIRAGDEVTLKLVSGEVVGITFGISAEAIAEDEVITGTITAIRLDRYTLIVETDQGSTRTIIVSDDAVIKRDGSTVGLNGLREDDEVEIGMEGYEAVRIEAVSESSSTYRGEVTRLNLDDTPREITIKSSTGSKKTYVLHSSVDVEFEGLPLDVDDILVGDEVSLRMLSSKVREVTIRKRTTSDALGKVVSVTLDDGYYKMRLETSTTTQTYWMIPDVVIEKDNKNKGPRDLKAGDRVVVSLAGDVITKVIVLN